MRRATSATQWILSRSNDIVGLSLGADACAEHETGVAELREALGVPTAFREGIKDRTITKAPTTLHMEVFEDEGKGETRAWMVVSSQPFPGKHSPEHRDEILSQVRFYDRGVLDTRKETLVCAWDSSGFLVHVRGDKDVKRLQTFFDAFVSKDIVFGGSLMNERQASGSGGLVFLRASKVDLEVAARALAEDQSRARLEEAAAPILAGLSQKLRAAGRSWFALSPRWKDKEESEVLFWLNPMEQGKYSAGLYTATELAQWAEGKGPVVKEATQSTAKAPRTPRR